jgi:hypothetical protein
MKIRGGGWGKEAAQRLTEHDTLVTSTELLEGLLVVQTLGNIGRLLLNGDEDVASLVVEALVGAVVANVLDGLTDNLLVVESSLCGDFTKDHDHAGLCGSLTSNLGEGVLSEAGIEDSVRDLVGNLVGVTLWKRWLEGREREREEREGEREREKKKDTYLADRLGSEEEGFGLDVSVGVDHCEGGWGGGAQKKYSRQRGRSGRMGRRVNGLGGDG